MRKEPLVQPAVVLLVVVERLEDPARKAGPQVRVHVVPRVEADLDDALAKRNAAGGGARLRLKLIDPGPQPLEKKLFPVPQSPNSPTASGGVASRRTIRRATVRTSSSTPSRSSSTVSGRVPTTSCASRTSRSAGRGPRLVGQGSRPNDGVSQQRSERPAGVQRLAQRLV